MWLFPHMTKVTCLHSHNFMKTQSLITGRFQPPTIMHKQIINSALKYSDIQYVQIVESKQQTGNERNPLSGEFRQKLIKQMFPEDNVRTFIYPTGSLDDIIHKIEKEDNNVVVNSVFCGTDRLKRYAKQLDKYFKDHQPIDLIEIDRDVSEINDISQSSLREQIVENNISIFKQLQPQEIYPYYDEIQEYIIKAKKLLVEEAVMTEGIKHIEHTDQKEFIEWIRQIIYKNEPIIQSIKYDGIQNISFTFKNGNVYQQRISKGQTTLIESPTQWSNSPIYNGIRSQHQFMIQFYKRNKQIFFRHIEPDKEYSVDCEIIPPIYGNILKYNRPYGTLVWLRPLDGFSEKEFKDLQDELQQLEPLDIKVKQYRIEEETLDVMSYESVEQWKIDNPTEINISKYQEQQKEIIEQFLVGMEEYMDSKPYFDLDITQYELLTQNLNQFQKPMRSTIKQYKEEIQENLSNKMIDIKSLLVKFVNEQLEEETGEPIEGIVLRRGKNQTKIVDREYFTKLNKFYWKYISILNSGGIDPYTNEWMEGYTTQFKKELQDLVDEKFRSPIFRNSIKATEGDSIQTKIINYVNKNKKSLMANQDDIRIKQLNVQEKYYSKILDLLQTMVDNYNGGNLKIKITRASGKEETKEFDSHMYARSYEQFLLAKKDIIEFIEQIKKQDGMMQVQVIYFKLIGINNNIDTEEEV